MLTHVNTRTGSDKLVTLAQARDLVNISRSKLYELLAEDAFPAPVKIGRTNFFSEREVQAWIAERLGQRKPTRCQP